jgi:hypothetical protein
VVTKGKAWSVEEELRLKELFEAGVPTQSIAAELSKTEVAVGLKVKRLGLKDDLGRGRPRSSSSSSRGLELPAELPTIEEAAKILGGAMLALTKPGVSKAEVKRWKAAADVAWKYKECMADLVNYKELEREIVEWREKYEELAAKRTNLSTR